MSAHLKERKIIINFSQSTILFLTKIKLHVRHKKFILYFSIFINNELPHLWYKLHSFVFISVQFEPIYIDKILKYVIITISTEN